MEFSIFIMLSFLNFFDFVTNPFTQSFRNVVKMQYHQETATENQFERTFLVIDQRKMKIESELA